MRAVIVRTRAYIVVLLALLVVTIWTLVIGSMPVSGDRRPIRVSIARGLSANKIADLLAEHRLIRSQFVFVLTCRIGGHCEELKPGVYELNRSMSAPEIIKQLVSGESLEAWVTIPEGFTARQIGDLLGQKRLADPEGFVRVAVGRAYDFPVYAFIHGEGLEGYLFPDTYLVARGTEPRGIIIKMLDAFEAKVLVALQPAIEKTIQARFGLGVGELPEGLYKVLTLASLVEREARRAEDRPLIAAVLWNRLAKNMKLQVCATVSYVPGVSRDNKSRVYEKDTRNSSPYNTYAYAGLPPGPICNPGLASIKAVLRPAEVDYLYYVAKPDGTHVFSRTYEEHLAAKAAIEKAAPSHGR